MLTLLSTRLRRSAVGQDGFTFAELLVAASAGIVVIIGLCSIMTVTLHQSQRTFTKIDATRRARTALALIENELHSACVNGNPPVQTGSTSSQLIFLSYYGDAANPSPVWHQLTFSGGKLTDASYNATYVGGGVGSNYAQGSLIGTTTLLTNVAQQGSTSFFQYYKYVSDGTDASGDTYMIVPDGTNLPPGGTGTPPNTPLTTPLVQADASSTVEVLVNMLVGSASETTLDNPNLTAVDAPVTDSISLRLTTPPDYVPSGSTATGYGPCS